MVRPEKQTEILGRFLQLFDQLVHPLYSRLSTRLLFTLTMLAAIPLIIVGLFMRSIALETLSEYIQSQHSEIARRAESEINLFLDTPPTLLKILLETKDIVDMQPYAQNLILNKVLLSQPIFDRIFTIDTLGNEVTTTAFGTHITEYAEEDFFRRALEGNSFFTAVRFNEQEEPYVISSHPVRRFGSIVGVLGGQIDLKKIWDLVDEVKIGESGYAFVTSGTGQLIAHPEKRKVIDQETEIDLALLEAVNKDTISSQIFYSPDGVEIIGTFAPLKEYDWIIVIQQPVDEAFAVANTMLYQVFAFVALVILVAILLAYLLEKRITSPINTLVDGVKRYGEGDLEFRIEIKRYEEIAVLANEFNAMAEKLLENQRKLRRVERLAAMSRFATLVSHEIRNPLNSMNINMQILKREMENPGTDPDKKRKYFDIITAEINRMDNLIKNFLMISRPPRFAFLPHDIHNILEEVILIHSGNAEKQNVKIIKDYSSTTIPASVDRDQLKQVFHNIIVNALQAMPGGGVLTIRTSVRRIRNRVKQAVRALRIDFIDTGEGIPKSRQKEIFDLYFTSKKTGTGLGLAIARQIIDGHFGTITVKSEEGKGTTVTVNVPFKSVSAELVDDTTQVSPVVKDG